MSECKDVELQSALNDVRDSLNDSLRAHEAKLTKYEGEATRSDTGLRYDLIPPIALKMLARRLAMGAAKHGERNWEKGGADFREATLNHLLGHIAAYMANGGRENVEAIICNAAFLCFFEQRIPYGGQREGT